MAQPFDCLCGKPTCRGRISGAKDMTKAQLEGVWLNGHIHELLKEQTRESTEPENGSASAHGPSTKTVPLEDATAQALENALKHAEKVVEASRNALQSYLESTAFTTRNAGVHGPGNVDLLTGRASVLSGADTTLGIGLSRRGVTSRELSGEMGGDTLVASGS